MAFADAFQRGAQFVVQGDDLIPLLFRDGGSLQRVVTFARDDLAPDVEAADDRQGSRADDEVELRES